MMFSRRTTFQLLPIVTGICSISLLLCAGCASRGGILGVDCCAEIPAGAIPEAAGNKVCGWQSAQVDSALADQAVLYRADFIGDRTELSPSAKNRLARNVASGFGTDRWYLIEPSGDNSLDVERVGSVAEELVSMGVEDPNIEIATPAALGMRGTVAEQIAAQVGGRRSFARGSGTTNNQSRLGGQTSRFGSNLSGGIF